MVGYNIFTQSYLNVVRYSNIYLTNLNLVQISNICFHSIIYIHGLIYIDIIVTSYHELFAMSYALSATNSLMNNLLMIKP